MRIFPSRFNTDGLPRLPPGYDIWAVLVAMGLIVFVTVGCRSQYHAIQDNPPEQATANLSVWASPHFAANRPRRVLILHTGRGQPIKDFPRQLANAVAAECRSLGLFESIVPNRLECSTSIDEISEGLFYENEIIRMARKHNADSVLLFRVNEFRFQSPMQASVTFAMIDVHETIVTYSQDGVWNLRDGWMFSRFEAFLKARSGGETGPTVQIRTQSPLSFAAFIAYDFAASMSQVCQSADGNVKR